MSQDFPILYPAQAGCRIIGYFTIPGKCKSKANEKTRTRYRSPAIRMWEEGVELIAKTKLNVKEPHKQGWVLIQMYSKTHTHIDLSNSPKSILDALVNAGIFKDDKDVAITVPFAIIGESDHTEVYAWSR